MTLTRRDGVATGLTALIVLVFFANRQGWDVPLVGDSVRWAAVAVLLLGIASCSAGTDVAGTRGPTMAVFGVLGTVTLAMAVIAVITASQAALALLVLGNVLLWAIATSRHLARDTTHGTPLHA